MINKTLIFLSLTFIFVFTSCSEKPCTDDGCPEFHELEVPTPTEDIRGKLDIEQWLESPKIEPEIDLIIDELISVEEFKEKRTEIVEKSDYILSSTR